MLLPGPQCVSWVPVPPPIAAVSPSPHSAMCHFQVSSHCCWVPFCHRMLADYGPPIAAARPLICHGPLYRLLMLLPGPQCVMPCAPFRSPHTAAMCSIFSSH
ncbi:unnamed protein product [Staurois parvus]|uniref:Secreted protein n=1 Tax=Staurois parvus TaxID=386267 RepID=A0ABN9BXM0_9NEOB|nr:unnamed protein product [Staurois parvus]